MRVCMVTTFFGGHGFGGDAATIDRLSRALARRGHEVDVIHSVDAFHAAGGDTPRAYEPPPGVRVHAVKSRAGRLASLWSHQTGAPYPGSPVRGIIEARDFDVVHFHNISLIGGPGILHARDRSGAAVKLMTAHEQWLTCPLHILWKLDRELCEQPQCVRCSLHAHRPPQLWRSTGVRDRALATLDAIVSPSRHTASLHAERGITAPLLEFPPFLPDGWGSAGSAPPPPGTGRPYFAAVGRLIKVKGFQQVVEAMRSLPDADLRLAGSGPFAPELRALAADLPNVRFLGHLDEAQLSSLYAGAVASVIPSLCYEVFPTVFLESFSRGTPVVARRQGSLQEIVDESGGGLTFASDAELVAALQRLVEDEALRARLGAAGREAVATRWSETTHVEAYVELVRTLRERRSGGTPVTEAARGLRSP